MRLGGKLHLNGHKGIANELLVPTYGARLKMAYSYHQQYENWTHELALHQCGVQYLIDSGIPNEIGFRCQKCQTAIIWRIPTYKNVTSRMSLSVALGYRKKMRSHLLRPDGAIGDYRCEIGWSGVFHPWTDSMYHRHISVLDILLEAPDA